MAIATFLRMLLVALVLWAGCSRPAASAPAPAPALGDLHLIDQDARPFQREQLRGRVWITAFMYTSCPMECPVLTQRMGYIQKLLAARRPEIQLLSISVNPQQDTPAVLREYGTRFHRDPGRWTFLTGQTDPVLRAVSEAFDRALRPRKPGGFPAQHGDYLVLIDGEGQVQGFYRQDDQEVARLLADADRLAAGNPGPL